MHKFIIVGHPQSGYQEVEALLLQCGMMKPKPSRREGLAPTEIDDVLCRAYHCPSPSDINSKEDVRQIEVAPVWQGMALDLMLANVDQTFWGWSDPNAIYLLDYWKSLDPSIKFIFVYNDLTKVFTDAGKSETPNVNIDNWRAFNSSILHFHYRNLDRCVLIHARQAKESVNTYLEQLRSRLDAPVTELPAKPDDISNINTLEAETAPLNGAIALYEETGPLERLITQLLVKQQPEVDQLYEELQSAANLPLAQTETEETPAQLAWNDLLAQKQRLLQAEAALKNKADTDNLKQENELLLAQLHQIQEELERYYHENKRLKSNQAPEKKMPYGAAERIKQQLSYRLGATMIEHSRSFMGLLTMIWALLQTVRIFKKELRNRMDQKLPPISAYADVYKAEQVKQHLSYKLGQAILTNAKSPLGWLRMPFAIRREAKDFRQKKALK